MAVPMEPSSNAWSAYFPPGFEELYDSMGFNRRWPSFKFSELCCKGTGSLRVNYETMDALQTLRYAVGGPIIVYSFYRSEEYNRQVGGAEDSLHMAGRAVDTPLFNGNLVGRAKLVHLASSKGFRGFGFYKNFNHIDTGRTRFWDETGQLELFGDGTPSTMEIWPH